MPAFRVDLAEKSGFAGVGREGTGDRKPVYSNDPLTTGGELPTGHASYRANSDDYNVRFECSHASTLLSLLHAVVPIPGLLLEGNAFGCASSQTSVSDKKTRCRAPSGRERPGNGGAVPVKGGAGAGESVLVVDGRGRVVIAHRFAFALADGVEALD